MLYRLSKNQDIPTLHPIPLSSLATAGWSEKNLEDVLASRLDLLLRDTQLMVITQERKWQEEADILAVDVQGTLYIFEIKRTESDQSNLLQVIRYSQIFGQYSYDNLEYLFRQYRRDGSTRLTEAHQSYFELPEPLAPTSFNQKQQFIVVTAGIDTKTLDAIRYWEAKGLPIEPITYHVYKQGDEFILQFTAYSPTPDDYIGLVSREYVVNTNVTFDGNAYKEMLATPKAAAYYERKTAVDSIQRGDRLFLYHTRVGIIAAGRATESVRVGDRDGDTGEEHFIPLRLDFRADPVEEPQKCVAAWEINRALGTTHSFRGTAFSISKEMADTIVGLLREKHSKQVGTD